MKQVMGIAALAAMTALAGCGNGGGGSSSVPVIAPTSAPTSYSSRLVWRGGTASLASASAYDRLVQGARGIRDVGFATPVTLMAPHTALFAGANGSGATVLVVASPMPSISPGAVTFTIAASNVQAVAPDPTTTQAPPSGALAAQGVKATLPGAQSTGTVTAAIPAPVSESPQIPVVVYKALYLGCGINNDVPGVAISDAGDAVENDDPAADDLYVKAASCPGAFNDPAQTGTSTLYVPGGAVIVPIPAGGFSAITTASFTGTPVTTLHYSDLFNPTTGVLSAVVFKKLNGTTCRFTLAEGGLGNLPDVEAPIACHGTAPDGF